MKSNVCRDRWYLIPPHTAAAAPMPEHFDGQLESEEGILLTVVACTSAAHGWSALLLLSSEIHDDRVVVGVCR